MASATRAYIYCRVSTSAQEDEGTSLDTQEARCRAYANDRGYQVADVFRDVYTGAKYRERPALSALRERVRADEVDVMLAHALDRLSRNQAHLAIIAEEVEDHGARLEFVTEDFEDSAVGKFIRSAKSFAAEIEREKIRERSMRGREERVRLGRPLPSSRPLYGYQWRDETHSALDEDPLTAPVVCRIFAEAVSGRTIRGIARGLAADGIPTPTGKAAIWETATIWKMLRNPAYSGRMYGLRTRTEYTGGRRRDVSVPLAECVALPDGTAPALVDTETFAAVAARLAVNRAQATRNNRHPEDALLRGGFARCGYCGNTAAAIRVKRDQHPQYRCNGPNKIRHGCPSFGISAGILDEAVWAKVQEIVLDRTLIEREVARLRSQDPVQNELTAIDRRVADIDRRRSNLTKRLALFDDEEAAALLAAEISTLTKERRQHEAERNVVLAERDAWEAVQAHLADIARWRDTVAANLDMLDYAGKRLALEALGIEAHVYAIGHTPRYEITARIALDGSIVSTASRSRSTCAPATPASSPPRSTSG
jgi:site-specific DNA recombinase